MQGAQGGRGDHMGPSGGQEVQAVLQHARLDVRQQSVSKLSALHLQSFTDSSLM
jgi:hypothetical protein